MRLFRLRFRLFGSVFAAAAVTVGIIAIASAGPSVKPASAQVLSCAPGTTVQTADGPVCGITSTTAAGVNEWLGIPYAAPPVGDLTVAATTAANTVDHDVGGHGLREPVHYDLGHGG